MTDVAFSETGVARIARRMAGVIKIAIVLIIGAGLVLGLILFDDPVRLAAHFPHKVLDPASIDFLTRTLIVLVNGVTFALTLWGLLTLHAVFNGITHGAAFDPETGLKVKRAGQIFLATALYAVVARIMSSVLVTFGNPPGMRSVTIGVTMNDLLACVFAGSVICLGYVLLRAAMIDHENKSFI